MKQGIHPDYKEATVTCSCGNTFKTGSVKKTSLSSSATNVTHSTLAVKNSRLLMVAWIVSTKIRS